ncbi:hypothetical protein [Metapseudomonas otitidis]|uniref:hypothetical protein n=1 Tax=Metapseudomonas otitidis TaxID=319939 RepID=UPI0013F5986E|nr:hypothetical protein [Pseudomonas otitidis]
MPSLKIDFLADWHEFLRTELSKTWDSEAVKNLQEKDLVFHYFDSSRRAIKATPRLVKISDIFSVPPDHEAGWSLLKGKIEKGDDLRPHLSRGHLSHANKDPLLDDWGVHHFHLGQAPSPRNPQLVERTGPLVFAYLSRDVFYAIGIYGHCPVPWSKQELVEILHRNWPEAIAHYRVLDIPGEVLTEEARTRTRKRGALSFTTMSDGTVYLPLSGGVTHSGQAIHSVFLGDQWADEIQRLQESCISNFDVLLEGIRSTGARVEGEVLGRLVLNEQNYAVSFPQFRIITSLEWPNNFSY